MSSWKKLEPHNNPHIGCLNCGCAEMRMQVEVITLPMNTRLYNGFGGWTIIRDAEYFWSAEMHLELEETPTLMRFENIARKDPNHDWRAELMTALRDETYQRQGKNRWVLVSSGIGFA